MIQAFEVVNNSTARSEFDTKWITPLIDSHVFMFFKKYISVDAYNCFLTHLISIPSPLLVYTVTNTYIVNQIIQYDQVVYKKVAIINPSTQVPKGNTDWIEAPRFDNVFLEGIWNNSLKRILAESILQAANPSATWQSTSRGLIAMDSDNEGGRGATTKEFTLVSDNQSSIIYNQVEYLKNYITLNRENIPCLEWYEYECGYAQNPLKNIVGGTRRFGLI